MVLERFGWGGGLGRGGRLALTAPAGRLAPLARDLRGRRLGGVNAPFEDEA